MNVGGLKKHLEQFDDEDIVILVYTDNKVLRPYFDVKCEKLDDNGYFHCILYSEVMSDEVLNDNG